MAIVMGVFSMGGWTVQAKAHTQILREKVDDLQASESAGKRKFENWRQDLDDRKQLLERSHSWWDSLKGDKIEETWSELHHIEVEVDRYESTPDLLHLAEEHVHEHLPRARAIHISRELKSLVEKPQEQRSRAIDAIREAHQAAEDRHASERNWQRGIFAIS
ncbi:MAG TPA: hypothetical protein VLA54_08260, partial [Acidimicrobiia bacterium]|nr:hypothetical protein [Acidimicrobiia bacterium]